MATATRVAQNCQRFALVGHLVTVAVIARSVSDVTQIVYTVLVAVTRRLALIRHTARGAVGTRAYGNVDVI